MHVIACALYVQPLLATIDLIPLGAMAIALLVMGGYGVLQLWPGQQARQGGGPAPGAHSSSPPPHSAGGVAQTAPDQAEHPPALQARTT